MAKHNSGPTRRVRKDQDQAWEQHYAAAQVGIQVEPLEVAWQLAEIQGLLANPLSEAEAREITDGLTDYHFMPTPDLEIMVGTAEKGSRDYRMAQAVLLQRPAEFQPGHGAVRYSGADMPKANGGK